MLLLLDLDTHLSRQPLYGLVLVMLAIPGFRVSSYGRSERLHSLLLRFLQASESMQMSLLYYRLTAPIQSRSPFKTNSPREFKRRQKSECVYGCVYVWECVHVCICLSVCMCVSV